jgi:hypothetical protein
MDLEAYDVLCVIGGDGAPLLTFCVVSSSAEALLLFLAVFM